jgi:hypothetical protein
VRELVSSLVEHDGLAHKGLQNYQKYGLLDQRRMSGKKFISTEQPICIFITVWPLRFSADTDMVAVTGWKLVQFSHAFLPTCTDGK